MRREITIIAFLSVFVLVNFVSVKDFLSQEYFNFNGITTNTGRFQALPPVHVNSSWIGNQWIPPRGYHTFSPVDFLDYFASSRTTKTTTAKKPLSVLILGDSTGRRTYATLFALLEAAAAAASSPATSSHNIRVQALDARHVIDFGKNGAPNERCLPKSADDEKYPGLACVRHIPSTMGESHIHGNSTQQSTSNNKTHHDDDDDDAANRFDLFGLNCLSTFASLVQDPNSILWRRRSPSRSTTAGDKNSSAGDEPFYSLVIFAFGPWEYMNRIECGVHDGRLNSTLDAFGHLFQVENEHKQQPQQRFVWRTWGTFGTSRNSPAAARAGWQKSRAHNGLVKKLISEHNVQHYDATGQPSAISYVDWGQAMLPRLLPQEERIIGDIDPHYGLEARMAFNQMLLNHLIEQDRLAEHSIPPWQSVENDVNARVLEGGDYVYDSSEVDKIATAFLSRTAPKPVLSPDEQEEYDRAQAVFCPDCRWQGSYLCLHRKDFMIAKHKVPPHDALISVVKNNPRCNKTYVATL